MSGNINPLNSPPGNTFPTFDGSQYIPPTKVDSLAPMPMLQYLTAIGDPRVNLEKTLNDTANASAKINNPYYNALTSIAEQLTVLSGKLNDFSASWNAIRQQEANLQQAVTTYNTSVTNAVSAINPAIEDYSDAMADYNNGVIDTDTFQEKKAEYLVKVKAYQDAMLAAYSTYVGVANAYTEFLNRPENDVAAINKAFTAAGLPGMQAPTQAPPPPIVFVASSGNLISSPYRPPLTNFNNSTQQIIVGISSNAGLPLTPLTIPTMSATIVIDAPPPSISSISQSINAALAGLSAILLQFNNVSNFFQDLAENTFNQRDPATGSIIVPASFIEKHPVQFLAADQSSGGSGPGTVVLSAGLSSRNLSRALTSGLNALIKQLLVNPAAFSLQSTLQSMMMGIIEQSAKETAEPTIRQLTEKTIASKKAPTAQNVVSALSFADKIREQSSSDTVEKMLEGPVEKNPATKDMTPEEKEKLVASLGAALKAGLLNVALDVVAGALGAVGLSGLLLSNLPGVSDLKSLSAPTEENSLNNVLDNPLSVISLKSALTAALMASPLNEGITQASAEGIVNNSVNAVISQLNFKNLKDLQGAFGTAFLVNGLKPNLVQYLSQAATNVVATEGHLPPLDTRVNAKTLNSISSNLPQSQQQAATAPSEVVLQSKLLDKLLREIDTNEAVADVLKKALVEPMTTNREFRDNVLNGLLASGVTADDANRIAGLAVDLVSAPSAPSVSPLENRVPQKNILLPELAEELSQFLLTKLTSELDEYRAKNIVDHAVRTLIGANSIFEEYNLQIRILRERNQQAALNDFVRALPTLTRASLPLFALRQQINEIIRSEITMYMDPIAQDSLARSSPGREPGNFKRNLDIRI